MKRKFQLNPAIAYFKGLVKIMLYTDVFIIANICTTMKLLLGTKICMLHWRNYVKSGCTIAGFYCIVNRGNSFGCMQNKRKKNLIL